MDTTIRSIRMPKDLGMRIEQVAEQQDRSFNGQVLFLLKLGFSVLDGRDIPPENSGSDLLQQPIFLKQP